ncbi:MAG: beta-ketoacyl-[acyl-carrier-protein] synthase family protein [Planctomycetota bacterium]
MAPSGELVISGVGVVTPIGIGLEAFEASLRAGRSGVRRLNIFDTPDPSVPQPLGSVVTDFDAKLYVRPRKSLKVMSREIQLGFAAADMAVAQAGIQEQRVEPDRFGVLFGADMMACDLEELIATYRGCTKDGEFQFARWGEQVMSDLFPLWMLKYLPNMPACHIGIALDARGPNNTITLGEVSSLAAVLEAYRVVERGQADVMVTGGTACRLHPTYFFRGGVEDMVPEGEKPEHVMRPFDALRRGAVRGEGAAAFVLESQSRAKARGAAPWVRILGGASCFEIRRNGQPLSGKAIRQAIRNALADAGLAASDIGHVNAHGMSRPHDDRIEAQAIRQELGDVPVMAPKSYFGTLAAGAGAAELAVSVLALKSGLLPATLNYEHPDPECPVNVVHGAPLQLDNRTALVLNHDPMGQAVALVIAAAE